ncbi:MAG: HD domain-containing protein [Treponema sp.]|jgi:HD-GYP domain-containing protein (c-di-GMP phosphodiesterase class II)|nr:HD domain-containing protein [Treponema sp.]
MLKPICVSLVTTGGLIMLYSITAFFKSLVTFKTQANEQKIFTNWIYTASMFLMLFFLLGYITVAAIFIIADTATTANLIIALVFFFGAVFVCAMVITLRRMSAAISKKIDEIKKTLVNTVEAKDTYTQGHSVHVAEISELIYKYLPEKIKTNISKSRLMDAAILHDIGKIGIPDIILNKPGKLTPEERSLIEQHTVFGKKILEPTSYQLIGDIICYHHERIDGNGYHRIKAEQIPIESKIIAVADTFSALCTDRIYRPKKTYEEAAEIMQKAAGTQLDAEIVRIFCAIPKDEFESITFT